MASQLQNVPDDGASAVPSRNKQESLNERFFRYFQQEITALQEQMDRLANMSSAGGETRDAIDHCLAGISRLSSEVNDASSYIPPYDQRIYAEAIKALREKLAETKETVAPRQKFSFKTARKNASAVSLADMAELEAQGRQKIPGYQRTDDSPKSPQAGKADSLQSSSNQPENLNGVHKTNPSSTTKQHSGSDQTQYTNKASLPLSVNSHSNVHLTLSTPRTQRTVPVSITSLNRSILDILEGRPFAALSIKSVTESLLMCGEVKGAAHVTGVTDSVIAVSCQQFRMHDCNNVTVFLGCSSTPIIENCQNIRFTHIPNPFMRDSITFTINDTWSRVDDFSWPKMEQNPNWKIIDEKDFNPDNIWKSLDSGDGNWSLERSPFVCGETTSS